MLSTRLNKVPCEALRPPVLLRFFLNVTYKDLFIRSIGYAPCRRRISKARQRTLAQLRHSEGPMTGVLVALLAVTLFRRRRRRRRRRPHIATAYLPRRSYNYES